MASDYAAIRAENEVRYGTDIVRIGRMLLVDRYDDRTHFIFELLQNAEDALARRTGWSGKRSVRFQLKESELVVSHFGKPFDESDVGGICGIAESTKGFTSIGRFGIGFKSVYAFTDRPRIHSGSEDFAIEGFVWPVAAAPVLRTADETVIVIPLSSANPNERQEITGGLQRLGARALLFLRHIEEIEWAVKDGPAGLYLRSKPDILGEGVRRVALLGQEEGSVDLEEHWLVFSKEVATEGGASVGYVELAISVVIDERDGKEKVRPVGQSPLVVFFPTVLETHLGFLVQGPYRTTPSRDNVPRHDPWNQRCVQATAGVLGDALSWLRNHGLLDAAALRCLPLDRGKFGEGSMFAPLFEATRRLLTAEPLLPRYGEGHGRAAEVRLARTQELRDLFDATQLARLHSAVEPISWLTSDISPDRAGEVRQYLMRELGIAEITPESILTKLDVQFLEAQPDEWVLRFYEFLNGLPALRQRAAVLPLVRLTNGTHVPAQTNGLARAFLPGPVDTDFPTVRPEVCSTDGARGFLRALGLTEPDPVDDVVWNVLPRYRAAEVNGEEDAYEADIRRILAAYGTDSTAQREKLLAVLRETPFVMALDTGDGGEFVSKPGEVYLATERLKSLFAGVPGVMRVDDAYSCLRGEDVRELLEACGALRYLRPIKDSSLSWQEKRELRVQAGHAETSGRSDDFTDWSLLGLEQLLKRLSELSTEERRTKATLIWEELAHLEERRGKGVFTGEYAWTHRGRYNKTFDAKFVRQLNEADWIPDDHGTLHRPNQVLFDSLGWKPNPFLVSKIHFKPPIIEQLAKEAGIEPGVLDLLKRLGVTSEADLRARLGMKEALPPNGGDTPGSVEDALKKLLGDTPGPSSPVEDPAKGDPAPAGSGGAGLAVGTGATDVSTASALHGGQGDIEADVVSEGGGKRPAGNTGGRPFISYVAVRPNEEEPDPDGLDQSARMALEQRAIDLVLRREPRWQRTPEFNRGFDLFIAGPDGRPSRWCEVKAMTGSLRERPVGLSRAQFECAREHREEYWLYVVEQARAEMARIVRIQDPAGRARTYTFDHGWLGVAEVNPDLEAQED